MSEKHKNRATSYDVAKLAGVSQSTVSRCFQNGAPISGKLKEKVETAARELNYQPNAIARGLIMQRTGLIGIMVSPSINFYYPEALFEVTERLSALNLRSLLFTARQREDLPVLLDQLWQYQVDGVISISFLEEDQYEWLNDRNIPVVMFNRFLTNRSSNSVWCDTEPAINELVAHLAEQGHERVAVLAGPETSMVNLIRMANIEKALGAHNLKMVSKANGDFLHASGGPALREIMASETKPSVVISTNDMMALGAIDEARYRLDMSVPEDIAFTGIDGINAAGFSSYDLTTIRQPIDRMAEAAVTMLAERIEDPSLTDEKRTFSGTFITGESSMFSPR
jgi:DNA-binding LacI/PurR family transcriptional regulator